MTNSVQRSRAHWCFALASLLFSVLPPLQGQSLVEDLRRGFANPPDTAKPMVRWWWFGIAAEKPEMLRELQQMKADGFGGAELAFEYPQVVDDPAKGLINRPFLSAAMLDDVTYAQSEGRKLGLRIDVTLGSGWPYGGPATSLAQAAGRLRCLEIAIPPDATRLPAFQLEEGESVISISLVSGEPKHWDAATAQLLALNPTRGIAPSKTSRTALIFIAGHTRQRVKRAAVGAEGWVLDPFSREAVATHLKSVGEPLLSAFGTTPPYAIFSDSLEAYGADWTPELPDQFHKRRGYDLLPHLPELVSGGTPAAEKVRHDWGKTLTELVDENYLSQINAWAIGHHTKFRSQTYGEPAVSLSSQRLVALPEGEGPQWRAFSTLRWASSANHLFGNNVTSAETFTWLHSPVFRATPLDMKAEVDLHFLIGVNQIICHGWPYSPPEAGEPGWSLYAAAVFNDHNPWHPVMPDVARYMQRVSYLLRQGEPATQIALLLPTDDAWASFSPGHVTVTGEMARLISPALMSSILSAGYNVDFIDADAIDRLGIPSPVLVIPPTERIPVAALRKIQHYVSAGGRVISVGRAPSLDGEGQADAEVTSLSRQLFELSKSTFVPDESTLGAALHKAAIPDLQLTSDKDEIGFVRRKLSNADIYFVVNTSNHPTTAHATFSTTYKFGEQWDAGTGAAVPGRILSIDTPIEFAPYGSAVFVFSDTPPSAPLQQRPMKQVADLNADWNVIFPTLHKSVNEQSLTDWLADPSTKFYSGVAVYQRDFLLKSLPSGVTFLEIEGGRSVTAPVTAPSGPGMRAWYEPPVREAAIVFINGHRAGFLWHPPYRIAVGPYLRPGENHIEVRVYNTAINGWAAMPPHDYKPLIAKYGDRFQMQDLDKVQPVSSGLLGNIRLIAEESH
ncbi:glycoside hydrolase family 2, sugar binding [Acidisarcina polymorpha]|uniref:Glycoside hydrolase family 2, sugar binding n=1 Tax=Acidisarcina polymorpha TaxID=2211140 RepID=A0A2Z5FU07_9BACT|nr:glycosyl hydrolase [Acidisarcina polymorpha]AXC10290.1 glycoside hydrolase family 2, sugar binding [Acidisarcina polymorpha]